MIDTTRPTIVIDHGAWTDASSFAGMQRLLTDGGYPITFSGVGAPAAAGQRWETLPSWYVAGTANGSIPLSLQLRVADRAGSTVTQLETGHLSMVTHPRDVADVILAAATSDDLT